MRLKHDNFGKGKEEKKQTEDREEKTRSFRFFKNAVDSIKQIKTILAVSVAASAIAVACGSPGKYQVGDADVEDTELETVDSETDSDIPDAEPDTLTYPDTDTIEDPVDDDVTEDSTELDIIEDEVEEDSPPTPTCFEVPTPIDPATDSLLNNSGTQDAAFDNTGPESINTDVQTNISMTGYPTTVLGVCPDDSNAVAFVANPDSVIAFTADVSMEAGASSWSAVVPEIPGETCPAFSSDDATLVTHNDVHQQVPKNADMGGMMTHAGFDFVPVTSTLISYEKDEVTSSDGSLTVTGTNFNGVNTIKSLINEGNVDIEVEMRVGDSSSTYTYTGNITGLSSKEARVYATSGDQMYEITWDTSSHIWCSRCMGNETFDLEIPGEIICKVLDSCGCVGDGFDINIIGASIDSTTVPPHLRGLHNVSSPLDTTGTVGVSALSDPSSSHPSIHIILEKGSVGWDDGSIANFDVVINAELVSEHQNPNGDYDTRLVNFRIRVVDPWCWGSLEPTYDTVCGCIPEYD